MMAGASFALFTSESTVNVAVTSGKVSVVASAGDLTYTSTLGEKLGESNATKTDNTITIERMVPGDRIEFDITIHNESDVTVNYRTAFTKVQGRVLWNALQITVVERTAEGAPATATLTGESADAVATPAGTMEPHCADIVLHVTVAMPEDAGNEYQGKTCQFSYAVQAVQGNAPMRWQMVTNTYTGTKYDGSDVNVTLNAYDVAHTFMAADQDNGARAIAVFNGASLTLDDVNLTTTVETDTGKRNLGFFLYNGASLTINSGEYVMNGKWGAMIWGQGASNGNRNTVTINGGSFKVDAVYETGDAKNSSIVSAYSATDVYITGGFFDVSAGNPNVTLQWTTGSSMTVTGGTFVNYNPANHDAVPSGYEVQATPQADGKTWYTVVASAD